MNPKVDATNPRVDTKNPRVGATYPRAGGSNLWVEVVNPQVGGSRLRVGVVYPGVRGRYPRIGGMYICLFGIKNRILGKKTGRGLVLGFGLLGFVSEFAGVGLQVDASPCLTVPGHYSSITKKNLDVSSHFIAMVDD